MQCRRCGKEVEYNQYGLCTGCMIEGVLMTEMGLKEEFERECEEGTMKKPT